MVNAVQFAVLQREPEAPTPEQMKGAFKAFNHLTDADAVRLAVSARGILMRHLGQDTARAVQQALQAEGVGVTIVSERDLPRLPEALSLHRLEVWPQALTIYDPLGRPTAVDWEEVTLVAAGAVLHFELNKTQTEFLRLQHGVPGGANPKTGVNAGRAHDSGPQFLLEILLGRAAIRYQINAAEFRFKHVIDRPGLSIEEKFIWLVRELCHHAPHALLNHGASRLREGLQSAPIYGYRQVFVDELVWLLWRHARSERLEAR